MGEADDGEEVTRSRRTEHEGGERRKWPRQLAVLRVSRTVVGSRETRRRQRHVEQAPTRNQPLRSGSA